MRQGPQLQQVTHPTPHEPRHRGHFQIPLATAASTSSPCLFRRHIPQNARGARLPFPHASAVQKTCVSTVFWRHQWHVTPSSLSYTRAPTEKRRRAKSPSVNCANFGFFRPDAAAPRRRAAATSSSSSRPYFSA